MFKQTIKEKQDTIKQCFYQEHFPPHHIVFQPGQYEHQCSKCGNKIIFDVDKFGLIDFKGLMIR